MQNQSQPNNLIDSDKVEAMFDGICNLKVVELRALQEMLCSRLSLKIIAPISQIVDAISAQKEQEMEAIIQDIGQLSKVEAIKAIKDLKALGLMEAKAYMDKPLPWSLGVFDTEAEASVAAKTWSDKGFTAKVK